MKERDYIKATNYARVWVAIEALRNVLPLEGQHEQLRCDALKTLGELQALILPKVKP